MATLCLLFCFQLISYIVIHLQIIYKLPQKVELYQSDVLSSSYQQVYSVMRSNRNLHTVTGTDQQVYSDTSSNRNLHTMTDQIENIHEGLSSNISSPKKPLKDTPPFSTPMFTPNFNNRIIQDEFKPTSLSDYFTKSECSDYHIKQLIQTMESPKTPMAASLLREETQLDLNQSICYQMDENQGNTEASSNNKHSISYSDELRHLTPMELFSRMGKQRSYPKLDDTMITDELVLDTILSESSRPEVFSRNLLYRMFTLCELKNSNVYGCRYTNGVVNRRLDRSKVRTIFQLTYKMYPGIRFSWMNCVLWMNKSIRYIFTRVLSKPIFNESTGTLSTSYKTKTATENIVVLQKTRNPDLMRGEIEDIHEGSSSNTSSPKKQLDDTPLFSTPVVPRFNKQTCYSRYISSPMTDPNDPYNFLGSPVQKSYSPTIQDEFNPTILYDYNTRSSCTYDETPETVSLHQEESKSGLNQSMYYQIEFTCDENVVNGNQSIAEVSSNYKESISYNDDLRHLTPMELFSRMDKQRSYPKLDNVMITDQRVLDTILSESSRPEVFARNLLYRMFTLCELKNSNVYGCRYTNGVANRKLDRSKVRTIFQLTYKMHPGIHFSWMNCVLWMNKSIKYIFTRVLVKPIFNNCAENVATPIQIYKTKTETEKMTILEKVDLISDPSVDPTTPLTPIKLWDDNQDGDQHLESMTHNDDLETITGNEEFEIVTRNKVDTLVHDEQLQTTAPDCEHQANFYDFEFDIEVLISSSFENLYSVYLANYKSIYSPFPRLPDIITQHQSSDAKGNLDVSILNRQFHNSHTSTRYCKLHGNQLAHNQLRNMTPMELLCKLNKKHPYPKLDNSLMFDQQVLDRILSESTRPEVFARNLLYRMFTLCELENSNVYGRGYTGVIRNKRLDGVKIRTIRELVFRMYPNVKLSWRNCVLWMNKSIRYIVNKFNTRVL